MRSMSSPIRVLLMAAALAAPVTAHAQFTEGFDDITTLADWYFQNNSEPVGDTDWFQGEATVFDAYDGALPNSYIAANFQSVAGAGTISNWMLTPQLLLEDGAVFSFFTRVPSGAGTFPDRLELRLSTSGASTEVGTTALSTGDFGTLLLSVNPDLTVDGYPDDWTQFSVTLSGIGAPTMGRFGFRYFVTDAGELGENADYIGIDAVSYSAVSVVPEPSSVILLGAGLLGLAVARRRRVR